MIRKQISKFLCRKDNGRICFDVPANNQKIYTEDFKFEHDLVGVEITIRARYPFDSYKNTGDFLNVKMQRKKTSNIYHSGDNYRNEYDNIDDFFVSFPVGRAGNYTQKTFKIQSAFPGQSARFEIRNPGDVLLSDCEIIVVQDIFFKEEDGYPLHASKNESGYFGYYQDARGGYIRDISPTFIDKITTAFIDDQEMIMIPKFYYRVDPGENAYDKGFIWSVSERLLPGYKLHPAFVNNGEEIDQFWIAAHEASKDGDKASSKKGKTSWFLDSFSKIKQACEARNTGGVDGFHMLTIYELAAIQMLFLVDLGGGLIDRFVKTPDLKWRGISKFWGNKCLVDGIKTEYSGNEAFIHIFDNKGNKEYVNTGYFPPTSNSSYMGSSDMIIKETSQKKGDGFDLSSLFFPRLVCPDGSMNGFFGDMFSRTTSSTQKYWAYGQGSKVNRDLYKGLFAMFGRIPESGFSGVVFRLAKI